ncbi:metal-sensing transcriptional repressor [Streptomyces adustus]
MTAVLNRLRRVQGQVAGMIAVIEDGRDCADVVLDGADLRSQFPHHRLARDDLVRRRRVAGEGVCPSAGRHDRADGQGRSDHRERATSGGAGVAVDR